MQSVSRSFNRGLDELRPVTLEVGVNIHAEGSCLVTYGFTRVLCTASVENSVPPFLKGSGKGWVTAEYSMLPRATNTRVKRERDRPAGRTAEIQRLIGRSLRSAIDFKLLGEKSIVVDCDVLQADGGTRTASITGAYVALAMAIRKLQASGVIPGQADPIKDSVAGVSVGIRGGRHFLDLDFAEDSSCDVDMNIVMTGSGKFVEVQGTAESEPFHDSDLHAMTQLGSKGIQRLTELQKAAVDRAMRIK
jgi:ribonuclease PH